MDKVKIERTTLDGRVAERHVSYDENGNKVVEIFEEDKRPLHLSKRITQEHKEIVAKETTEYVKNGEVVEVEVEVVLVDVVGHISKALMLDPSYMCHVEAVPAPVATKGSPTILAPS